MRSRFIDHTQCTSSEEFFAYLMNGSLYYFSRSQAIMFAMETFDYEYASDVFHISELVVGGNKLSMVVGPSLRQILIIGGKPIPPAAIDELFSRFEKQVSSMMSLIGKFVIYGDRAALYVYQSGAYVLRFDRFRVMNIHAAALPWPTVCILNDSSTFINTVYHHNTVEVSAWLNGICCEFQLSRIKTPLEGILQRDFYNQLATTLST